MKQSRSVTVYITLTVLFIVFVHLSIHVDGEVVETVEGEYVETPGDNAVVNHSTRKLRVKGNGYGPENVAALGRRKILAKRAARLDAYRNLLEVVKGVTVSSDSEVRKAVIEKDIITATLEGQVLKGMRVAEVEYFNDGGCEVTVEIDIDQQGAFMLTALDSKGVKVNDRYPNFDWAALRKQNEELKKIPAKLKGAIAEKQMEIEALLAQNEACKKRMRRDDLRAKTLRIERDNQIAETEKALQMVNNLKHKLDEQLENQTLMSPRYEHQRSYLAQREKALKKLHQDIISTCPADGKKDAELLKQYNAALNEEHLRLKEGLVQFTAAGGRDPENPMESPEPMFTGLLIDVRGHKVAPVLAPVILNGKMEKIYGLGVMPVDNIGTTADYFKGNLQHAMGNSRSGDKPLIIRGVKVVNLSDIVISDPDVEKLTLVEPQMAERKVTILL